MAPLLAVAAVETPLDLALSLLIDTPRQRRRRSRSLNCFAGDVAITCCCCCAAAAATQADSMTHPAARPASTCAKRRSRTSQPALPAKPLPFMNENDPHTQRSVCSSRLHSRRDSPPAAACFHQLAASVLSTTFAFIVNRVLHARVGSLFSPPPLSCHAPAASR